jgi:hypothetical protein
MTLYKNINNAFMKTELDRQTWASQGVVVQALDIIGSGEVLTNLIDFGTVFQSAPAFAYGVELQPGETLVTGDYPFVTCGVSEWSQYAPHPELASATPLYGGAYLWINVSSSKPYKLRFRFSFEGTIFKNVERLRNG